MTTTQNTKPTATAKRYAAIQDLCESTRYYYAEAQEVVWTKFHSDAAEVAASIRTLAPLGRTARWTEAVEDWAVKGGDLHGRDLPLGVRPVRHLGGLRRRVTPKPVGPVGGQGPPSPGPGR